MNDDPDVHFYGAFAFVDGAPADDPALVRGAIRAVLGELALADDDVQLATSPFGGKQGAWRTLQPRLIDEAIAAPKISAIDILYGTARPPHVRMTMNVQLRFNPMFDRRLGDPLRISFLSEATEATGARVVAAGRRLLETCASSSLKPISGGVFRAPYFNEAHHEIGGGYHASLPDTFVDRISFDRRNGTKTRTLARRLYPITLLGPALAAQVSADALRAAGAAAIDERNGVLIVDAPGGVVETWDAGFLARTIALRQLLWPLTIKNPADAP